MVRHTGGCVCLVEVGLDSMELSTPAVGRHRGLTDRSAMAEITP